MQIYSYQAVNESGATISGTIEAESQDAATTLLVSNGLIPSKVKLRTSERQISWLSPLLKLVRQVKTPELILFTKQFRTMVRAGIPMMSLLKTIESQTENAALKRVIVGMSHDVSQGSSLYESFRKHPDIFSSLYCSMVRAGEASGALSEVLERLIDMMEHDYKIRSEIRSALQYPAMVLSFLVIAFFVLLTYVIPKFSNIFMQSGLELPLLTRICIMLYNVLTNYWYIVLLAAVVLITSISLYLKSSEGRLAKDKLLLSLPLLGPLFQKAAMSRFAGIFSILQSSGVGIMDSMHILAETVHNEAIAQEFEGLLDRLEEGRGIAAPLRQSRYFTPIVINMTAIGEETGNMEEMLDDIAAHYDWELSYTVKRFNDSLGPILIVGMAAVIGFFALAIYMPMWDLARVVQ